MIILLNYCVVSVAFTRGCCCVCGRLTWPPCVVAPASALLLQPLCSVASAFARGFLTSVSSYLNVRAWLLWCQRAVCLGVHMWLLPPTIAYASACGCFGVHVRLLRRPRACARAAARRYCSIKLLSL